MPTAWRTSSVERRARHAGRRPDHGYLSVWRRDQLDEPHAVAQPEHGCRTLCRTLGGDELVGVDPRGMDVRPGDAESRPVRAEAVGERQEAHRAVARDDDGVHLRPVDEPLEHRFL